MVWLSDLHSHFAFYHSHAYSYSLSDFLKMSIKWNRTCLTIRCKEKKGLKEVDSKILTKTEVVKKYGILKITLSIFNKQKQKIMAVENALDEVVCSQKYFQKAKFPDLEKVLAAQLWKMRNNNILNDENLLKTS